NLLIDDFQNTVCGNKDGAIVRFKWDFNDPGDTQSAYRLEVASTSAFLNIVVRSCDSDLDDPDAKCPSAGPGSTFEFINDPAAGYAVLSWDKAYYWRLKVWDSEDVPSTDWIVYQDNDSPPESFTTPSHYYPSPSFTLSPQNSFLNELVKFTDNSEYYPWDPPSYLWDFDNGSTSTKKGDTTTTYDTAGLKTVRLTLTGDIGACDTTRQVTVGSLPPEWREVSPIIWLKKFLAMVSDLFKF
ncbi:MAG: PKD domain-containing protein, partial [Patescibacteria group bacterium]